MPSIWPLTRRGSSPPAPIPYSWNLTLDEPALATRIVSTTSLLSLRRRHRRDAPARIGVEYRDRAGRHAGAHRVGARGEDDRHPGAEHDAGRVGLGEEREVF